MESPFTRSVLEAWSGAPETMRVPTIVEEAWEMSPEFNVASPVERKSAPAVKSPDTDEEAFARNP